MGLLAFIGLVLVITALVGTYMFIRGGTGGTQPTPQCSCKMCEEFETPEEPVVEKKLTCGDCAWRHPSNCKECPVTLNNERAKDDGVFYPEGDD
jgi:hypothetical protein